MDENIKREIILEHYQNPINRKRVDSNDYIKVNTRNNSCIDNIDIYLKIKNNVIEDITFEGEACAISISSTSIMIENLIGKTIDEAKNIIENFENMLDEKDYNPEVLKNGIVYDNINKQSSRKTCASLPYRGVKEIVNNMQKD